MFYKTLLRSCSNVRGCVVVLLSYTEDVPSCNVEAQSKSILLDSNADLPLPIAQELSSPCTETGGTALSKNQSAVSGHALPNGRSLRGIGLIPARQDERIEALSKTKD
jgi:hypothetical protein